MLTFGTRNPILKTSKMHKEKGGFIRLFIYIVFSCLCRTLPDFAAL